LSHRSHFNEGRACDAVILRCHNNELLLTRSDASLTHLVSRLSVSYFKAGRNTDVSKTISASSIAVSVEKSRSAENWVLGK